MAADSDNYVEFEIESDAQTLADRAIDNLRAAWPDWEPHEGDLEVVQIESVAPMAQNAAEVAARVPSTIFRAYGTKMIGVPYTEGSFAQTTLTFNLADTDGHWIEDGWEVDVDGYAFVVDERTFVPQGQSVAVGIPVSAAAIGAAANDLTGSEVTPITAMAFVDSITVDTPTAGGADPEVDVEYQNRLSRELQLQATTLVSERDFELMSLSVAGVGRVVARHDGARNVLITATTPEGEVLPAPIKDTLIERVTAPDLRLVNTVVTVADASYAVIDVTYAVKALPGFDEADLIARIDAMLTEVLQPKNWGQPKNVGNPGSPIAWVSDDTIRVYKLVDLIGDVDGVDYVDSVLLQGDVGAVDGAGNWVMTGDVALPRPGTMTGSVV